MLFPSLSLAVVAGTVVANAFLIPPGFPATTEDVASVNSGLNPKNQFVDLPCPSCGLSDRIDGDFTAESSSLSSSSPLDGSSDTALRLNFRIAADGQHLEMNGTSIFPLDGNTKFDSYILHVQRFSDAIRPDDIADDSLSAPPRAVVPLRFHVHPEQVASDNGDVVIPLELELVDEGSQMARQDRVAIDVLRMADGELLILRVEAVSTRHALPFGFDHESTASSPPVDASLPTRPMTGEVHCAILPAPLCRLKAAIMAKLFSQSSSHRGHPCSKFSGSVNSWPASSSSESAASDFSGPSHLPPTPPFIHHGRHHHMRPYGSHHHHHDHHSHSALASFARGLVAVLVPVVAGITVGLAISLVGLMVARAVSFLWVRVFRGGRRCRRHTARHGRRNMTSKDSDGWGEEEEFLPRYEEAPAYVEQEELAA